jgi:hypothetical protein
MTREWTFSPRRSGAQVQAPAWLRNARLRHVAVAALVSCSLAYFLFYTTLTGLHGGHHIPLPGAHPPIDVLPPPLPNGDLTPRKHHIDDLILSARAEFSRVLRIQSLNVKEAADRYRAKRGRHPPPGFDKWFDYTQNKSSIVIEDFFDRIYHDLNPFWAIEARLLRYQARAHDFVVSVRCGNTTFTTDGKRSVPWLELWAGLVEDIQKDLPDVDMPVNMMDESRLVVPWEDIDECLRKAELNRSIIDPAKVITTYTRHHLEMLNGYQSYPCMTPNFEVANIGTSQKLGAIRTRHQGIHHHGHPLKSRLFSHRVDLKIPLAVLLQIGRSPNKSVIIHTCVECMAPSSNHFLSLPPSN